MSDSKTGKEKLKGVLEAIAKFGTEVAKVGAAVGTAAGTVASLIKTNKKD